MFATFRNEEGYVRATKYNEAMSTAKEELKMEANPESINQDTNESYKMLKYESFLGLPIDLQEAQ